MRSTKEERSLVRGSRQWMSSRKSERMALHSSHSMRTQTSAAHHGSKALHGSRSMRMFGTR
jgi:hypothetical protein